MKRQTERRTERQFRRRPRRLAVAIPVLVTLASAPALGQDGADVRGIQRELLANPETANEILEMQDDPDVQAVLGDPATMRAVQSGDLDALLADPKIRALMSDPRVREMSRGLR